MSVPPSRRSGKPANDPFRTPARAKAGWRARAQRAVGTDSAPTWGLDLRDVQDGVEERRSRAVIDLAMRVGEATMATGSSAADVTATILRLTDAYGLRSVHVDVTFTSLLVSHHRGADEPVTIMRTVRVRSADYERLSRLQAFVRDIESNPVDVVDARARFDAILATPHLYRRGVITLASAIMCAGVCLLLNGSFVEIFIAFVNATLVDRVQLWLSRRRLASFFNQIAGAAIPTAFAVGLIVVRAMGVPGLAGVSPASVVAAGIVAMLAGMSVVGAAQDAIDGFYVTAGARTFEVVVLTLGVLVGVVFVLTVTKGLGAPSYLSPYARLNDSYVLQGAAAVVISATFAISSYSGPLIIAVSTLCGTLGWLGYTIAAVLGAGPVGASGLGALAVGIVSQYLVGRFGVPSIILTTAGIVPLLPGLMVYRGLYQLTMLGGMQGSSPGLLTLGSAGAIGLALAGGVSLGAYLGRALVRDTRGRALAVQRRVLRRATADVRE